MERCYWQFEDIVDCLEGRDTWVTGYAPQPFASVYDRLTSRCIADVYSVDDAEQIVAALNRLCAENAAKVSARVTE